MHTTLQQYGQNVKFKHRAFNETESGIMEAMSFFFSFFSIKAKHLLFNNTHEMQSYLGETKFKYRVNNTLKINSRK